MQGPTAPRRCPKARQEGGAAQNNQRPESSVGSTEDCGDKQEKQDRRNRALGVQAAIHLLLALLFPRCAALLVAQKWEIDNLLDAVQRASHIAADQSKVISIQIQYAQPGCYEVLKESRGGPWPSKLSDFGKECGLRKVCEVLRQVCQVTFTNLHSNSSGHAHLLESHAQRKMIDLTSRDVEGAIYQFYGAAAVSTKGMSVLSVGNIINGAPRVLVITLTMWTKDPTRSFELRAVESRNDDVFGLTPIAVCCVLLCVNAIVGVMMN